MSTTEILVLIGGLGFGYWAVSKLYDELLRNRPSSARKADQKTADVGRNSIDGWYEVLKVPPEATIEEIRRSYKLLMQQYHPDKVAALGDELKALAERKSKEITAAYRHAMRLRGEAAYNQ